MKYTVYGGVCVVYKKGFRLSNDRPDINRTNLTLSFSGEMCGNTRPELNETFPIDIWNCGVSYDKTVIDILHPSISKGVRGCSVYVEEIEYSLEEEGEIDKIDKMEPEKVGRFIEDLIRNSIIPSLQEEGFINFEWC